MKMRVRKVKKVRCGRQHWVDSGAWSAFVRRGDRIIAKVRAERKAHMDAWRTASKT